MVHEIQQIKDQVDLCHQDLEKINLTKPNERALRELRNNILLILKESFNFFVKNKELGPWEKSCLLSALVALRKNIERGESVQELNECLTHLKELTVGLHARTEQGLPTEQLKLIGNDVFEKEIQALAQKAGVNLYR